MPQWKLLGEGTSPSNDEGRQLGWMGSPERRWLGERLRETASHLRELSPFRKYKRRQSTIHLDAGINTIDSLCRRRDNGQADRS